MFCRVGWMAYYGLWPEEGGPTGGGSFNEDDVGAEVDNFWNFDGRYLGYVQAGAGAETGLNLRRIDPDVERRAEALDDVLVVLVAKRPAEGGQVVVGWYEGARCHASIQYRRDRPFVWSADPERAVLLPDAERRIVVPKGKGGMGQANVAYVHDPEGTPHSGEWIDETISRIEAYDGSNLIHGAAYNEADERSGYLEYREEAMYEHVASRVRALWPGAEVIDAEPDAPYELVVKRNGVEERVILRATEDPPGPIDFSVEVLDAVRASEVPYALVLVSSVVVRVRNGELVFSGGVVHRESPFRPRDEQLKPVLFRYSWEG